MKLSLLCAIIVHSIDDICVCARVFVCVCKCDALVYWNPNAPKDRTMEKSALEM